MSYQNFNFSSHFFADHERLVDHDKLAASDAFGPIEEDSTFNRFRLTSKVKSKDSLSCEVYAITGGQIFIQPVIGTTEKVNIVLKPSPESFNSFLPLRIKYFVYRGVDSKEIFNYDTEFKLNYPSNLTPVFLSNLWSGYLSVNKFKDWIGKVYPIADLGIEKTTFISNVPGNTLLKDIFEGKYLIGQRSIVLPVVSKGEVIGRFTGHLGLEVVLESNCIEGDLTLKLDSAFVQQPETILDISGISSAWERKLYKENILRFVDAAAFWGMHINSFSQRSILFSDTQEDLDPIHQFERTVAKFRNTNKHYVYIYGRFGRSYDFYFDEEDLKVNFKYGDQGLIHASLKYEIHGWPIIILYREILNGLYNNSVFINLQQRIAENIDNEEWTAALYSMSRNGLFYENGGDLHKGLSNTPDSDLKWLDINGSEKCAGLSIYSYFDEYCENNGRPYYQGLWTVDVASPMTSGMLSSDNCYVKPLEGVQNCNLSSVLAFKGEATRTLNRTKVVFDSGMDATGNRKLRRMYVTGIYVTPRRTVESFYEIEDFVSLKVNSVDMSSYSKAVFPVRKGVSVLQKGTVNYKRIGTTSIDMVSYLTFGCLDNINIVERSSYMCLGILEEEVSVIVSTLPVGAYNIRFELSSVSLDSTVAGELKMYELGVRYEKEGVVNFVYPSSNKVYVYSIDNLLFCSSLFVDFQRFFVENESEIEVDFLPSEPYRSDFGFDWMRLGKYVNPDFSYDQQELNYSMNIGKLYKKKKLVENTNSTEGNTMISKFLFRQLEMEYPFHYHRFKTVRDGLVTYSLSKKYLSMLTILPPHVTATDGQLDFDKQLVGGFSVFNPAWAVDNVGWVDELKVNRIALLDCLLRVEDVSNIDSVDIEYDSQKIQVLLKVNNNWESIANNNLPLSALAENRKFLLKVSCLDELNESSILKVKIRTKELKTFVAGALQVKANSLKQHQKSEKFVFIPVTFMLDMTSGNEAKFTDEEIRSFFRSAKKWLRHSLINPIIIYENEINLYDNSEDRNAFYNDYVEGEYVLYGLEGNPLHGFLLEKLKSVQKKYESGLIGDSYKNVIKVFMLKAKGGENTTSIREDYIEGFAEKNNKVVFLFNSGSPDSLVGHELYHSLNVAHSFANHGIATKFTYTFSPKKTDNLMDYSKINKYVWSWQSEIARLKAKAIK